MNVDVLHFSMTNIGSDKWNLNRSISTAAQSPLPTPRNSQGCPFPARTACLLAASIKHWKYSSQSILVFPVVDLISSRCLDVVSLSPNQICVIVGGLLVPLSVKHDQLETTVLNVEPIAPAVCTHEKTIYAKILAASREYLGCLEDVSSEVTELLRQCGCKDLTIMFSGAVILNDLRIMNKGNPFEETSDVKIHELVGLGN